MLKRIGSVAPGAICALALSVIAAPQAHARDLKAMLSFQAGKVTQSQVEIGDEATARKLLTSFVGAWMVYLVDRESGETWWGVYDVNDGHPIGGGPEPEYDEEAGSLVFKGKIVDGVFKGARFTGEVTMDEDGNYAVTQRVQMRVKPRLDVTFSQPLEPIDRDF
jgi:hypothetical protein